MSKEVGPGPAKPEGKRGNALVRRIWATINSSIVQKTAVSVSCVFICALVLLTALTSSLHSAWMRQRIVEDKEDFVTEIANMVDDLFENLSIPLISLANQNSVQWLVKHSGGAYDGTWLDHYQEVETSLSSIHVFYDYIVDVGILDGNSKLLFSLTNSFNYRYPFVESEWFQEAMQQPGSVKCAPPHGVEHLMENRALLGNVFTIIYPLPAYSGVEGYVICEVDASRISSIFKENSSSLEGYILTDSQGKPIYDYRSSREEEQLQEALRGIKQEELETTAESPVVFETRDSFYVGRYLPETGWILMAEISSEVINGTGGSIRLSSLAVCLGAILISVLLMRSVTRRLQSSVESVLGQISSYDGTAVAPVKRPKGEFREIAEIRTKFEEMTQKVDSLINDVYVAKMQQQNMELEMLINQINPHFLYNVLQTIHGTAVLHGDREIEDMIASLGEILHYTIDHTNGDATLAQELQHAQNYLSFYQRRFPRLFVYSVSCEEALLGHRVIKYLLQPIVENSVKHGFRSRREGGKISIEARREGNDLICEVSDNGCGISAERLEEIRRNMKLAMRSPSVGIANTDARIKIRYGLSYGIELESREGRGTTVRVRIPDREPQAALSESEEKDV